MNECWGADLQKVYFLRNKPDLSQVTLKTTLFFIGALSVYLQQRHIHSTIGCELL